MAKDFIEFLTDCMISQICIRSRGNYLKYGKNEKKKTKNVWIDVWKNISIYEYMFINDLYFKEKGLFREDNKSYRLKSCEYKLFCRNNCRHKKTSIWIA